MNDHKHVVVGIFVLLGTVILGTMIVWFQGWAAFIGGGYTVRAHMANAYGVRTGKRVTVDGIGAGEVSEVVTSLPKREGVWINMRINADVQIPTDYEFVVQQGAVGDVAMDFRKPKRAAAAPGPAKPREFLPTDGSASVDGVLAPPNLLGDELTGRLDKLATGIESSIAQFGGVGKLVQQLTELSEPRTLDEVKAGKRDNLWTALAQFQVTAKSLQDEISDPKSGFNNLLTDARTGALELTKTLKEVQQTLGSVQSVAETYQKAGAAIQGTSSKADEALAVFTKDAEAVGALIKNLNAVVEGVQNGKGTLGQLIASDDLHRQLVNALEDLRKTLDSGNRLITMWREEGLLSKEKK